jgi:hypothetical protein
MSTEHVQKLAQLNQRIHTVDEELAKLDQTFTDFACEFDGINGRDALKKADRLEQRMTELRRERTLSVLAQKKVQEEEQAEADAEVAEEKRKKQVAAKQHADAIIALHGDIDTALLKLKDLFVRRRECLQSLAETAIVDHSVINRISAKGVASAAACHVGLHRFLPLEVVAPSSFRPLTSTNEVLALGGIGQGNGSSGTRRVRLDNGNGADK